MENVAERMDLCPKEAEGAIAVTVQAPADYNVGGHIGPGTGSEIEYATALGKSICDLEGQG